MLRTKNHQRTNVPTHQSSDETQKSRNKGFNYSNHYNEIVKYLAIEDIFHYRLTNKAMKKIIENLLKYASPEQQLLRQKEIEKSVALVIKNQSANVRLSYNDEDQNWMRRVADGSYLETIFPPEITLSTNWTRDDYSLMGTAMLCALFGSGLIVAVCESDPQEQEGLLPAKIMSAILIAAAIFCFIMHAKRRIRINRERSQDPLMQIVPFYNLLHSSVPKQLAPQDKKIEAKEVVIEMADDEADDKESKNHTNFYQSRSLLFSNSVQLNEEKGINTSVIKTDDVEITITPTDEEHPLNQSPFKR